MRRTRKVLGVVAVTALAIGVASCGADSDKTAARAAAIGNERPLVPDLDRFLMHRGEEPGFRPGAAPGAAPAAGGTITGVKAYAKEMRLTPPEARRLRSEGFVSYSFAPIRGPRGAAGITNVALFSSAGGAQHNLDYETRIGRIRAGGPVRNLKRFTVPGIPGARGWRASVPRVANVFWVQGRCVLVLGNAGGGRLVGPLSTGARAIYERTNGKCP